MNPMERTWHMQQNNVLSHLASWQQGNKHKLTANQIAHLLLCRTVVGLPDKWWRNNFLEEHTPEMVRRGVEVKRTKKKKGKMKGIQRADSRMATSCHLIGGGHACSQAGKTRKCNSWKLSGYDISGSYSICSQTLKWRLAWRGGRKVTTVSSLPVNPTTPSVQEKNKMGKEQRGEE